MQNQGPIRTLRLSRAVVAHSLGVTIRSLYCLCTPDTSFTFSPGHGLTVPPGHQLLSAAATGPSAFRASCETCAEEDTMSGARFPVK